MVNRQIAINSTAVYAKTAIAIVLSLFSSRWILNSLGATDLGIFAVVGGLIGIVTVITGAMSSSSQRFLAHAIGSGDKNKSNVYFNACLFIHITGALAAFLVGQTFGAWFLLNILNIPTSRVDAAQVVYQCVLFSSLISISTAPVSALFAAKQRLALISAVELLPTVSMFVVAYMLDWVDGDRLKYYAVASAVLGSVFCGLQVWIAYRLFPEIRFHRAYLRDFAAIKTIAKFSGWTLFGTLGSVTTRQGSAVMLNLFFGPSINAAYLVAEQVSNNASNISAGFMKSVSPEVASREGRQERSRAVTLALSATRYAALITLVWLVPLAFQMEAALDLWLVKVPQYADTFALMLLLVILFDNLTIGYPMLVQSIGQIASYQVTVGVLIMLALPLSYVALSANLPPFAVPAIVASLTFVQMLARVGWVWVLADVSPIRWLREVVKPVAYASSPSLLLMIFFALYGTSAPIFIIAAVASSVLLGLWGSWSFGLTTAERHSLNQMLRNRLARIRKAGQ